MYVSNWKVYLCISISNFVTIFLKKDKLQGIAMISPMMLHVIYTFSTVQQDCLTLKLEMEATQLVSADCTVTAVWSF